MTKQIALVTQSGELLQVRDCEWRVSLVVCGDTLTTKMSGDREAKFAINRHDFFGFAFLKCGELMGICPLSDFGITQVAICDTITLMPAEDGPTNYWDWIFAPFRAAIRRTHDE